MKKLALTLSVIFILIFLIAILFRKKHNSDINTVPSESFLFQSELERFDQAVQRNNRKKDSIIHLHNIDRISKGMPVLDIPIRGKRWEILPGFHEPDLYGACRFNENTMEEAVLFELHHSKIYHFTHIRKSYHDYYGFSKELFKINLYHSAR